MTAFEAIGFCVRTKELPYATIRLDSLKHTPGWSTAELFRIQSVGKRVRTTSWSGCPHPISMSLGPSLQHPCLLTHPWCYFAGGRQGVRVDK
eukprot:5459652-Amphidinium_carterae.2